MDFEIKMKAYTKASTLTVDEAFYYYWKNLHFYNLADIGAIDTTHWALLPTDGEELDAVEITDKLSKPPLQIIYEVRHPVLFNPTAREPYYEKRWELQRHIEGAKESHYFNTLIDAFQKAILFHTMDRF